MKEDYGILEDVVRNSYAGVVWSHKIQEKQSDIYTQRFKWLEIGNIVAASITSVGVVSLIFSDPLWLKIASAVVSFVSVFIASYCESFDLRSLSSLHKQSACRLLTIRDKYKILLMKIELRSEPFNDLLEEYCGLVKVTDEIYKDAPSTSDQAVKRAGKALNVKKDNSFDDEEVDNYLPKTLRRGHE